MKKQRNVDHVLLEKMENDKSRIHFELKKAEREGNSTQGWVPFLFGISIIVGFFIFYWLLKPNF